MRSWGVNDNLKLVYARSVSDLSCSVVQYERGLASCDRQWVWFYDMCSVRS
jgi:hypothetical protein